MSIKTLKTKVDHMYRQLQPAPQKQPVSFQCFFAGEEPEGWNDGIEGVDYFIVDFCGSLEDEDDRKL